jgi:hypothetical protein
MGYFTGNTFTGENGQIIYEGLDWRNGGGPNPSYWGPGVTSAGSNLFPGNPDFYRLQRRPLGRRVIAYP